MKVQDLTDALKWLEPEREIIGFLIPNDNGTINMFTVEDIVIAQGGIKKNVVLALHGHTEVLWKS